MKNFQGHKSLIIWQKGMEIVEDIYSITQTFPQAERFGIISQMRRCAVSIPSNIAEGYRRKTKADFINFLHTSFGSAAELETQLMISKKLNYLPEEKGAKILDLLDEFCRMLRGFITLKQQSD